MTAILFSLKHKIDILNSLIIEWRSISSKNLFLRRENKQFIETEKGLPILLVKGIFIYICKFYKNFFLYLHSHYTLSRMSYISNPAEKCSQNNWLSPYSVWKSLLWTTYHLRQCN